MSAVKEELAWVSTFTQLPVSRRKEWVKIILDEIRSYRKDKRPNPEAQYLSDLLSDKSKFELIGISYNMSYIRVDDDDEANLRARFIHPWGGPKLLFKHKKLPILITAGADIRVNDAVTNEVKGNSQVRGIIGITG